MLPFLAVLAPLAEYLYLRYPFSPTSSAVVDLGYVKYQGKVFGGVTEFRGVPYAEPPLGPLRFRAPVALNESRVRESAKGEMVDVREWAAPCIQGTMTEADEGGAGSEDCLKLNVVIPNGVAKDSKLPVLFYIHGGGYTFGNPANFPFTHWPSQSSPFITVSPAYRLSSFGFLAHPDLPKEDLNAGFQDLIMALKWVNKHIGKFGGDPGKVTIMGHSAGGSSVELLLIAKGVEGLFWAAVPQSVYRTPVPKVEDQVDLFKFYTIHIGCTQHTFAAQMECLRNADVSALARAQDRVYVKGVPRPAYHIFRPVVDGRIITDYPIRLIMQGEGIKVPLLIGATTNETSSEGTDLQSELIKFFLKLSKMKFDEIDSVYPAKIALSEHVVVQDRHTFGRLPALSGYDYRHVTLKSCALVCKSFLRPSRRQLFRDISLYFTPNCGVQGAGQRLVRLGNVLDAVLELATFVRDLSLILEFRHIGSMDLPELVDIVGRFGRLESLSVVYRSPFPGHSINYDPSTAGLSWDKFSLSFQQALSESCSLTSLNSIFITGIHDIPPYMIRTILRIKIVIFDCSGFLPSPPNQPPGIIASSDEFDGTETLKIGSLNIERIQPLLSSKNFKPKTLGYSGGHDVIFNHIANVHRASIIALELPMNYRPSNEFDIFSLPRLTSISVSISVLTTGRSPNGSMLTVTELGTLNAADPMPNVINMFKTIRKGNMIQEITLSILYWNHLRSVGKKSVWLSLDEVLSSDVFSSLKVLRFDIRRSRDLNTRGLASGLKKLLSKLNNRGVLDIFFTDHIQSRSYVGIGGNFSPSRRE